MKRGASPLPIHCIPYHQRLLPRRDRVAHLSPYLHDDKFRLPEGDRHRGFVRAFGFAVAEEPKEEPKEERREGGNMAKEVTQLEARIMTLEFDSAKTYCMHLDHQIAL